MSFLRGSWVLAGGLLLGACNILIPEGQQTTDENFHPGVPEPRPFWHIWPFTALTTGDYVFDSSLIQFSSGQAALIAIDQIDDDNSISGFGGGTFTGLQYGTLADGASLGLKLGNEGGCDGGSADCAKQGAAELYELSASWTPSWSTLSHYYKFNNSWNDSKGVRHGTSHNGASFLPSAFMGSHGVSVDGVDDYVDYGPWTGSVSYTVSFWVKPSGATSGTLFNRGNSNGCFYNPRIGLNSATGGMSFAESGCAGAGVLGSTTVSLGEWSHVVISRDGQTVNVYLNGNLIINDTSQPNPGSTASARVKLGWGTSTSGTPQNHGSAVVDEVAIWDSPLTDSEVAQIYQRQSTKYSGILLSRPLDAGVSAEWSGFSWVTTKPLDKQLPDATCSPQPCSHNASESSSNYPSLVGSTGSVGDNDLLQNLQGLWHLNTSWEDTSGKGNDLSNNGAVFSSHARLGPASSKFDGVTWAANTTFSPALNDFSFSLWFQSTALSVQTMRILEIAPPGHEGIPVIMSTDGTVGFNDGSRGPLSGLRSVDSKHDGQWHHLLVTREDDNFELFIDGVSIGSELGFTNAYSRIFVGRDYNNTAQKKFIGYLDEMAVWSRVLHPNEIKQLYQRGSARLKHQVRSCSSSDCSDADWKGPDGTSGTYFSELNNNSSSFDGSGNVLATSPSIDFSSPPTAGRYFQYRSIFESDDGGVDSAPELTSVRVDPIHYPSEASSIYGKFGVNFYNLASFSQTLGDEGCPAGLGYNLSIDKSTWYWWDGSSWSPANGNVAQSNSASTLNTQAARFASEMGRGTVYVKAFLKSSGTSPCTLDEIEIGGKN